MDFLGKSKLYYWRLKVLAFSDWATNFTFLITPLGNEINGTHCSDVDRGVCSGKTAVAPTLGSSHKRPLQSLTTAAHTQIQIEIACFLAMYRF